MILPMSFPPICKSQADEIVRAAITSRRGRTPEESEAKLRGYVRGLYEVELEHLPFPQYLRVLHWAQGIDTEKGEENDGAR